jgi:hypothetical protein
MPIGSPASRSFYSQQTVVGTDEIEAKTPETKLYQAILGQAFEDAFGPDKYALSKKERDEALKFLKNHEDENFIDICENAGFDPGYIKLRVRKKFAEKFVSAINNISMKVRNKNEW